MLHCKNSRPEIFQAFSSLIKMRLKFQSTLREQYDTQWAINHEALLLVKFKLTLTLQTLAHPAVTLTSRLVLSN